MNSVGIASKLKGTRGINMIFNYGVNLLARCKIDIGREC